MQQVSPAVVQNRYPPVYHPYPTVPLGSPQSLKSIDTTVFGPTAPPVKSSKSTHHNHSHDVDFRRLILFNLPMDLVQEYLELYLEYLSGETEIERIDYSNLEDTTVMVTFKTELGQLKIEIENYLSALFFLLLFRYGRSTSSSFDTIKIK